MEKKTDRRIRKTKAQLRAGLAKLMQKKSIKEITVKELVEEVDINRSTFYLHYTDIYQMLESIENELQEEIKTIIQNHPAGPYYEKSFPFIQEIFEVLAKNREICNALLGPNGDMSFVHRIEDIISRHSLHVLSATCGANLTDIKYAYAFCLTGCVGMVKAWLSSQEANTSAKEMAELTYHLIMNALKDIAAHTPSDS
ncbi:MAG: TetR-like C-terminal domain-containing protein [Blautia sp.]